MRIKAQLLATIFGCICVAAAPAQELRIISPQQLIQPQMSESESVEIRDDVLFVGIPSPPGFPAGQSGRVLVYTKATAPSCNVQPCWRQVSQLGPGSGPFLRNRFGFSLAFDGSILVVGSPGSSSAWIFRRLTGGSGFDWEILQELKGDPCPDACDFSNFGISVAIAGNRVAVTETRIGAVGAAYVFKLGVDGLWHREAKFVSTTGIEDFFGISVALTENTALVGADENGDYVSAFAIEGGVWVKEQTLDPFDTDRRNGFGRSVAIDGGLAAIGASSVSHGGLPFQGATYLFERTSGGWSPLQKLVRSDDTSQQAFGFSVAMDSGRVVAAGRNGVYFFEQMAGGWENTAKLVSASLFSTASLHGLDIDGTNVVAVTENGVWIYDLAAPDPANNVVMEAETMFLSAGYSIEPGADRIFIADTINNPTGYAHLSFPGGPGTYRIEVQLVGGGTGLSVVGFYLNGERLGYQYFDFSTEDPKLVFENVVMAGGDDIILAGHADGDGGARVDKIVFVAQ